MKRVNPNSITGIRRIKPYGVTLRVNKLTTHVTCMVYSDDVSQVVKTGLPDVPPVVVRLY